MTQGVRTHLGGGGGEGTSDVRYRYLSAISQRCYISAVISEAHPAQSDADPPDASVDGDSTKSSSADDPTTSPSRWQGLYELLPALDAQIETLYTERGIHGLRPRFAYPLIRLSHTGPLTIRELARALNRSHSAISQTVAALRRQGLVHSEPGTDARTRHVALTESGQALIPFLEAEWRATEAAVAELDDEVPHALSAVVAELEHALERRPMRERILAHLEAPAGSVPPASQRADATDAAAAAAAPDPAPDPAAAPARVERT